jgi:diguanylate cyclase (GGDEF)-like protein
MEHDATIFKKPDVITPDSTKEPVFIVIFGEDVGKMFRVTPTKPAVIGRKEDADIILNEEGISRRHAMISFLPLNKIVVSDLQSTNGTFVNGEKITEKALQDGDRIQIGNACILKFSYQDKMEEKFQENLYQSATQDPLTGIYNKKFFLDNLAKEFSFSKRTISNLNLIIFDIDHFKKINDTYGHQAGDYVLKTISDTLKKQVRREDLFSRYGGEEFVLILKGKNEEHALMFAERIRKLIKDANFNYENKSIQITISMGISTYNGTNFENIEELIKSADDYLYKAKQKGRNRVECTIKV